MRVKRKVDSLPKDAKQAKKVQQLKDKNSPSLKPDNNNEGKAISGKNTDDDRKKGAVCNTVKNENLSPRLLEDNLVSNKVESPNLELNQLLQKRSMITFQGSVSWKAFLFPSLQNLLSVPDNTQQYFGLDLVEEGTERTFWTHKASVWQDLFKTVQEVAQNDHGLAISNMFNGILACPVRKVSHGPSEIQTFKSGKGQNI